MKYYYTNAKNEPVGPVPFEELEQLAKQGTLHDRTSVIAEGSQTWTNFAAVKAAAAGPAAPPPPAGSPASAAPAPAATRPLKFPASTVLGETVEFVLAHLRMGVSAGLLERLLGWCKVGGHYAVLGGAALAVFVAIFWAIKLSQFSIAIGGIGFLIAIALGQFAALRFLDAGDRLLRNSPTRMVSPAFPDCVALIWVLFGVGALFTGIRTSITFETALPLLPALVGTALAWIAAVAALHPATLNIEVAGGSGGEEAVGLISFLPKVGLRIVPALFALFSGAGVIALLLSFSERTADTVNALGAMAPGIELIRGLSGNAAGLATGAGLLVVACFLPFVAYVSFVLTYLVIDLVRAILAVPSKLDSLRH